MKKNHLLLLLFAALLALAGTGCTASVKKTYYLERANRWYSTGQFDKAEIEYLNVIRVAPQNAEAFTRLGDIYFNEGRFQKAAPFLYQGSQLATNDLDLRLKLGLIYASIGQSKEAHDEAEFILENNPQDPDALVLLAQSAVTKQEIADVQRQANDLDHSNPSAAIKTALGILASRRSDFKTATGDFQSALSLDSHFAAADVALGNVYWLQNNLKNAEAAYKSAADNAPPHSILPLQYGQFEIQTSNYPAAENFFSNLVKSNPGYLPGWMGLAEVAFDEKKYDECETDLNKAHAIDEDSLDVKLLDARLDLAQTNIADATGKLEGLVKLYPQISRIHYQLGLAYLAGDHPDKALNELRDAVSLNSNDVQASFLLAQLQLKSGDIDSAVDLLKQLLARQPDFTEAELVMAEAYRLQGRFKNALLIYQQMETSSPENPQFPLLAGSTFVQLQDEASARREFEQALAIQPENISAQEELAQLDLADKQFASAQKRIEGIIVKNPQQVQPQILLAKTFLAQSLTNQAETILSKASLMPNGSLAGFLLAQVYFDSRQDQQALATLQPVLQHNPQDVSCLMLAGLIQTDQKNYQGAADSYGRLLAINPQYGPALNNLAWLDSDVLGDLDKAYELAQRAHQLLPLDPSASDTLGWILFEKGQYSAALELFQGSTGKLPGSPDAQFHLGMAHYLLGDEDAARQALQNALASKTEFPGRGECETCLNILNINPANADALTCATLEKRISLVPNDPIAFSRLAAIYQHLQDINKAIALCQAALKANPQNVRAMILLAEFDSTSDPRKAYQLAQASYQLKPDDVEICATLGRLASKNANDAWAFSLLQRASRNQPDNSQILFDFANAAFCIGDLSDAQTAMQTAVQDGLPLSQTDKATNFLDLIGFYESPGQATIPVERVQSILNSDPANAPALLARSLIESQNNNPANAELDCEKLLDLHPNCTIAQKELALLYTQNLVDPQKAYPVALKAREAFPQDPQVAKALALILFRRGDYIQAADIFNTISDSNSADARLYYYLGISEFHLKNFTESKSSLQRALAMNLSGREASDARQTLAELK